MKYANAKLGPPEDKKMSTLAPELFILNRRLTDVKFKSFTVNNQRMAEKKVFLRNIKEIIK